MLNWGRPCPAGHPLRLRYPHRYPDQVLPEAAVPGISDVLDRVPRHDRRSAAPLPAGHRRGHRLPRVVLRRDDRPTARRSPGRSATRRWTEAPGGAHVWAGAHGDINLITALPRATAPGLQVQVDDGWVDAVAARGPGDHQHRDDARAPHERGDPHRHPPRRRRRRATPASATASCSSATRRRGRCCTRSRRAARPSTRSASPA